MIRFLHLADLHLGAELGSLGARAGQRAQELASAFERAVSFALAPENHIQAVVIAGDLFDRGAPRRETVGSAIAQLNRLRQGQVPVILVPGNHDGAGLPGSPYADPSGELPRLVHLAQSPNVAPLATLTLNGETVRFYGLAWDPLRSRQPYDSFHAEGNADYHVAVLHGTLDNVSPVDLQSRDVPLSLDRLAATGMDYIALGHVHACQEHRAGSIPVVYPGTLEARRLSPSELGQRQLVAVTLEKGEEPGIERRPWNQRTALSESLDLDMEAVETEEELAALIRTRFGGEDVLLRLVLSGSPPFIVDPESLGERLSGDLYHLELLDQTDAFDSTLVSSWAGEQTIRGLFIRKLQARLQAAEGEERQELELALKLGIRAFDEGRGHVR